MSEKYFEDKKLILVGLGGVGILVLAALFIYLRKPKAPPITNFQECVQAGGSILESYPPQCRTQKGEFFVERVEGEEDQDLPAGRQEGQEGKICENLCGDGICQEVVCMAVGCPCPETPESCPEDCPLYNAD